MYGMLQNTVFIGMAGVGVAHQRRDAIKRTATSVRRGIALRRGCRGNGSFNQEYVVESIRADAVPPAGERIPYPFGGTIHIFAAIIEHG